MASDETSNNETPKKAAQPRPSQPRPRPNPPRHTQSSASSRDAANDSTATDAVSDPVDDADASGEGRFDAIKDRLRQVPKWGWAIVAIVVIIIGFMLFRPAAEDDSSKSGEGDFTITYRQQLTQDGTQAGCFVLMEGTRAIGISCLPAK